MTSKSHPRRTRLAFASLLLPPPPLLPFPLLLSPSYDLWTRRRRNRNAAPSPSAVEPTNSKCPGWHICFSGLSLYEAPGQGEGPFAEEPPRGALPCAFDTVTQDSMHPQDNQKPRSHPRPRPPIHTQKVKAGRRRVRRVSRTLGSERQVSIFSGARGAGSSFLA